MRGTVLLTSGVLAALATLACALIERGVSVGLAAGFSGVVAVGTGLVVFAGAPHPDAEMRGAARVLGAAMVVWGSGQVLVGWAAASGPATFPTLGDQVSSASAPIGVVGLLLAMRPTYLGRHWIRMALDALLLGSATGLLLWRVSFRDVVFYQGFTGGDALAIAIVLVEITMVALLLLGWLRELDRGLMLVTAGFALYVLADQVTLHAVIQGHQWPWGAAAMWCVAWPAIGEGVLSMRSPAGAGDGRASETRVTLTTTAVTLVTLMGVMVALAVQPVIDGVTVGIGVVVIGAFAGREMYMGLQRAGLLRTLTLHALHDPLTGLGNRRAMTARLAGLGAEPAGAVLTLDLDGFKEINDLLGHVRGDALLVAVADRITGALAADCDAYRVGGDEFVAVVPGPAHRAQQVADALLTGVRSAAATLPGAGVVTVSASVGIARWSLRPGMPQAELEAAASNVLVESGVALHAAKSSGRDRIESYDGPVAAQHRRALDVELRLRRALAAGDIEAHYQPIIALDDGRVVGVEALARWTDPVLGRIGPDEFIAVAERCGLVAELGTQMMERALREVQALTGPGSELRVAVNVSPVQLRSPTFAAQVRRLVAQSGIAPERVVIEVTESLFVSESDPGIEHLHSLRRAGLQVAIDDFGSGYSALTYLSRLPASILKVDQSLTANIVSDPRALAVMRAVVDLGRSLPMDVAIEGIETPEIHDAVRALGDCCGQGWLYSAAVPIDQLAATIERLHARHSVSAG